VKTENTLSNQCYPNLKLTQLSILVTVFGTLKPKQSVSIEQINNRKIKSAQDSWNL